MKVFLKKNSILVLDDVLSKKDFKICERLIKKHSKVINSPKNADYRVYSNRWYPVIKTPIPKIIEKVLWSKKLLNIVNDMGDLSWKLFISGKASGFEVQVTYYENKGDYYDWHVDHLIKNRVLNYILYFTEPKGGQLDTSANYRSLVDNIPLNVELDIDQTIKPIPNRMVIIPSWIPHRIRPLISGKRITVNGHIKI